MTGFGIRQHRVLPFKQFVYGRYGQYEAYREKKQYGFRRNPALGQHQLGNGKSIKPNRKMAQAVIVIALKSKKICNQAKRHPLKREVTADRVDKHQKGHHQIAGIGKAKPPIGNRQQSDDAHNGDVFGPPDRPIVRRNAQTDKYHQIEGQQQFWEHGGILRGADRLFFFRQDATISSETISQKLFKRIRAGP